MQVVEANAAGSGLETLAEGAKAARAVRWDACATTEGAQLAGPTWDRAHRRMLVSLPTLPILEARLCALRHGEEAAEVRVERCMGKKRGNCTVVVGGGEEADLGSGCCCRCRYRFLAPTMAVGSSAHGAHSRGGRSGRVKAQVLVQPSSLSVQRANGDASAAAEAVDSALHCASCRAAAARTRVHGLVLRGPWWNVLGWLLGRRGARVSELECPRWRSACEGCGSRGQQPMEDEPPGTPNSAECCRRDSALRVSDAGLGGWRKMKKENQACRGRRHQRARCSSEDRALARGGHGARGVAARGGQWGCLRCRRRRCGQQHCCARQRQGRLDGVAGMLSWHGARSPQQRARKQKERRRDGEGREGDGGSGVCVG